jgi:hypothetical protein
MSWIITPQTKVPVDPVFNNVSLLLHGNGTNGSTTITDNSPTPKTVTAVGNAQISTAQSKFGGASIAFNGTGDALTATTGNLNPRTDAFTFESWAYIATRTNFTLISGYDGIGTFYLQEVGGTVYLGDAAQNPISFSATELPLNSWFHIAITFDTTTYRIFVSGVQKGSTTTLLASLNFSNVRIGSRNSTISITGYLDDFRITKGVARYTANFTPPAAPFPDI